MPEPALSPTPADVEEAYQRLLSVVRQWMIQEGPVALLGIANGGIPLVRRLSADLGQAVPVGVLNALFHRDDLGNKAIPAHFEATSIDFPVDDARIVLVDDVLASGRTVRAALNELFDYGRPRWVKLAVLVDTRRACLPIHSDVTGLELPCRPGETVRVLLSTETPSKHRIFVDAPST